VSLELTIGTLCCDEAVVLGWLRAVDPLEMSLPVINHQARPPSCEWVETLSGVSEASQQMLVGLESPDDGSHRREALAVLVDRTNGFVAITGVDTPSTPTTMVTSTAMPATTTTRMTTTTTQLACHPSMKERVCRLVSVMWTAVEGRAMVLIT
jgi:hypothetical protein